MDVATLDKLRRRYVDAAQSAARWADNMEEHVRRGTTPSDEELRAHRDARNQLTSARRAYLHALILYRQAL